MNSFDIKQFNHDIWNNSGMRQVLKQIPSISKLESMVSFGQLQSLTLKQVTTNEKCCLLNYEAVATDAVYPDVRENMKHEGIINGGIVLCSKKENKGRHDEFELLGIGVEKNALQIYVKVFNPGYKG